VLLIRENFEFRALVWKFHDFSDGFETSSQSPILGHSPLTSDLQPLVPFFVAIGPAVLLGWIVEQPSALREAALALAAFSR
jgi:hypothetical protein